MRGSGFTALAVATLAATIPLPVPATAAEPSATRTYSHLEPPQRVEVRSLPRTPATGHPSRRRPELARPPAAPISGGSGAPTPPPAKVAPPAPGTTAAAPGGTPVPAAQLTSPATE